MTASISDLQSSVWRGYGERWASRQAKLAKEAINRPRRCTMNCVSFKLYPDNMVGVSKIDKRLIVMCLSTEIFSKRRKIYACMKRHQSDLFLHLLQLHLRRMSHSLGELLCMPLSSFKCIPIALIQSWKTRGILAVDSGWGRRPIWKGNSHKQNTHLHLPRLLEWTELSSAKGWKLILTGWHETGCSGSSEEGRAGTNY